MGFPYLLSEVALILRRVTFGNMMSFSNPQATVESLESSIVCAGIIGEEASKSGVDLKLISSGA